jgi:hypothetical protein
LEVVQEQLLRQREATPQQLVERLHWEAGQRGGGMLRDDVALLALRRDRLPSWEHSEERSPADRSGKSLRRGA